MTSDGTNTYSWDAENRLIKITYPGTGNYSQFTYDGYERTVQVVETVASTVTSTKQFVWANGAMREARNSSGAIAVLLRRNISATAKLSAEQATIGHKTTSAQLER
jgi:YD repeat-containing protein